MRRPEQTPRLPTRAGRTARWRRALSRRRRRPGTRGVCGPRGRARARPPGTRRCARCTHLPMPRSPCRARLGSRDLRSCSRPSARNDRHRTDYRSSSVPHLLLPEKLTHRVAPCARRRTRSIESNRRARNLRAQKRSGPSVCRARRHARRLPSADYRAIEGAQKLSKCAWHVQWKLSQERHHGPIRSGCALRS